MDKQNKKKQLKIIDGLIKKCTCIVKTNFTIDIIMIL